MNKPKKTDCVNKYFPTLMDCKKAFASGDIFNAKGYYLKLNDILNEQLDYIELNDSDNKKEQKLMAYNEFNAMIDCLTYEELYTLSGHKGWINTDCEVE